MNNNKILEKVQMKVAISNVKEEDIVMENKTKNIFKAIITTITTLLLGSGVVYAGTIVYEKIWKTPEKVNFSLEITEETKKENITEEEAKEIAINKFIQIESSPNIVSTDHYKDPFTEAIEYRFQNEDNYMITINGKNGKFTSFSNRNKRLQDLTKYITKEQAVEAANKYYKLFGFKEGEYEISKVISLVGKYGRDDEDEGVRFQITYNKKYGDVFNPFENISMCIESKNLDLDIMHVENLPFDNNELAITKEEAIKTALEEDNGITDYDVKDTKAQLMVVKMNAEAYNRKQDYENHYKQIYINVAPEDRAYYKPENKIRLAWVVVISYDDTDWDVKKRYTEGKFSYFVDATTGEIIGGHTLDYINSRK